MGGTEKGKDREMPGSKNKEGVSEAIISKLLNDFNSAAVLRGSLDSNSNSNADHEKIGYEEIASSLKKLHLRKPANSRQRYKERKSQVKKASAGNKYNLSVAAVNLQRPVVWPGKLNSSSKKDDISLLQPSKLSLNEKKKDVTSAVSLKSTVHTSSVEEKSRIESELKKQNMQQFGCLSQSGKDGQFPSFSNLSKRHSIDEALPETNGSELLPSSSSSAKRTYNSSLPAAKHRRLYNEIHIGSDIAQCLDYRCSYSYEDNNGNCSTSSTEKKLGPAEENLLSEENKLFSASALQDSQLSPSFSTTSTASINSEITSNYDETLMDESNVNELASYFDDLLHIPKKMSVMAEMMYA